MTRPSPAPQVPSLRRRFASLVYELLLLFGLFLLSGAFGALLLAITGKPQDTLARLFGFAMVGTYFIWFWTRRGQTLAMQVWNIELVSHAGGRITGRQALLRYLAGSIWLAVAAGVVAVMGWKGWTALGVVSAMGVGYVLLAWFHPQRQFMHDALCGTRLVQVTPPTRPSTR